MRRITSLVLLLAALLAPGLARAQSGCAAIAYGAVLTAGQWQACFASKQDYIGGTPLLITGGMMTGPLLTAASTTASAGFNLPPGAAPTSPNNGDLWVTSGGLYVQINGVTVGPLTSGGSSGSFTSTYPIVVTFPSAGVVNYALNYDANFVNNGSNALAFANIAAGNLLANSLSGSAEPTSTTLTALIDRALGSVQGSVLNRGSSSWQATKTPTLGSNGVLGSLTFGNATSGLLTLETVTGALGIVTAFLPANTGILAELNLNQIWSATQSYGSGFFVLNGSSSGSTTLNASAAAGSTIATLPANTGVIAELNLAQSWTQPQTFAASGINILGTGAGYTTLASGNTSNFNYVMSFPALTDIVVTLTAPQTLTNKTLTSPVFGGTVTGNNAISLPVLAQIGGGTVLGNNGSALANVTATSTPVLGVAGSTVGTLGFANLSTGSITLQPATGALGSSVLTMPALTDTLLTVTSTATLTNKTIASSTDVLGGVTTTFGSDATGDVYYRNSSGVLTRLGIGSTYNALVISGGLPSWGQINLASSAAVTGALPISNLAQIGAFSLLGNPTNATANVEALILGTTLNFAGTTLNATTATPTQLGVVTFDNVTITLNGGGQLQAIGAIAASIGAGSGGTSITGTCTTNWLLYNNGGTLYCVQTASLVTAGTGISITGTTSVTIAVSSAVALLTATNQVLSGGATVAYYSLTAGTNFTVNCGLSPLQEIVNSGAFTITAPIAANSQNCAIRVINGTTAANAGAVTITAAQGWSGKTPGGATFATTPTISAASVTFTNSSANIGWTSPPPVNAIVFFATSSALPTNFAVATLYYVVTSSGSTITVSATPGGSAITAASAGAGTQTGYEPSIYDLIVDNINSPPYGLWAQVQ